MFLNDSNCQFLTKFFESLEDLEFYPELVQIVSSYYGNDNAMIFLTD